MFQHRFKTLYAFILIFLLASGILIQAKAQNTTAIPANLTASKQNPPVNKEAPKAAEQSPVTASNTTAAVAETPKLKPGATFSFDRWAIAFQCSGEWKEWEREKSVYAKDSLNDQLKQFDIEMLEFTMIMNPKEDAALLISKSQRQKPIVIEELVKERENVYKDAKAAGDVTAVNRLEQTTIDNKPGVIEDVERSNGGRAISMKIVSGQKVFEISLVTKDKKDFDSYRPVFDEILKTIKITE